MFSSLQAYFENFSLKQSSESLGYTSLQEDTDTSKYFTEVSPYALEEQSWFKSKAETQASCTNKTEFYARYKEMSFICGGG